MDIKEQLTKINYNPMTNKKNDEKNLGEPTRNERWPAAKAHTTTRHQETTIGITAVKLAFPFLTIGKKND